MAYFPIEIVKIDLALYRLRGYTSSSGFSNWLCLSFEAAEKITEKGALQHAMGYHRSLFFGGFLRFLPGLSGVQQQDDREERFLPWALLPVSFASCIRKVFGQLNLPARSPRALNLPVSESWIMLENGRDFIFLRPQC